MKYRLVLILILAIIPFIVSSLSIDDVLLRDENQSNEYKVCGVCRTIIGTTRKILQSKTAFSLFKFMVSIICRFIFRIRHDSYIQQRLL